MARFFIGLDLGQAKDYTAITIIEQRKPAYHVRHIERPRLGTPYPTIVERVKTLIETPQLEKETALVVDKTGVGAPVVDLFCKIGLAPIAITITGGNAVIRERGGYRVPKRDLVTTLQVLFQAGNLKVASGLELAPILVEELLNFKVKINVKTGHDSYEAWREGTHDDLVLSVAMACWYAEKGQPRILIGRA